MIMKKYFALILAAFYCLFAYGQTGTWKGKKAAVVLTYDDALNVHLDNVMPLLDSLGLKATFYLSAYSPGCRLRLDEWKKAALKGHELGNHTLFHPCLGNQPGREWVRGENDMSKYTVARMVNEVKMTNVFLQALDGKTVRTFAYTCGDTKIGDSSFFDGLRNDFAAARGVKPAMHTIDKIDLVEIDCYGINGETGEQLIGLVKQAMESNSLLVFLFHGVGGEHSLNVSLPAHRRLLQFLNQNEKEIWVAPMVDLSLYINQWKKSKAQ